MSVPAALLLLQLLLHWLWSQIKKRDREVENHRSNTEAKDCLDLQVPELHLSFEGGALSKEHVCLVVHRRTVGLQRLERDVGLEDSLDVILHDAMQLLNFFAHLNCFVLLTWVA